MEKLCSYCRLAGHHRGKCPTFKGDIEYMEKFRQQMTEYEKKMLTEHLPIGSIISKHTGPIENHQVLCIPVSYHGFDKGIKIRMEHYAVEKPLFTKWDSNHVTIVNRIYADRKWRKQEEKNSASGVYLASISGEKMQPWTREGQPHFFTFGEINYEIRRDRIKMISPA